MPLGFIRKKMSTTIKEGLSYRKYYNGLSVYFFMMKKLFRDGNTQRKCYQIAYVNVKVLWIPSTKLLHDNFLYPYTLTWWRSLALRFHNSLLWALSNGSLGLWNIATNYPHCLGHLLNWVSLKCSVGVSTVHESLRHSHIQCGFIA